LLPPWRSTVLLSLLLSLSVMSGTGCTNTRSERGIDPAWNRLSTDAVIVGKSTQSDVLDALGPPSQVINHERGTIFYYLHEQAQTRALILILYNTAQTDTSYDRAIFFFDRDGVLSDYAIAGAPAD
jgi:hypothetical protein